MNKWTERLEGMSKADWINVKYEIDKAFNISDREAAQTTLLTAELMKKAEKEV